MMHFGAGPTLKQVSPHLRDHRARIDRILTITETDSVIEGLPPMQEETRQRIRRRLTELAEPSPERAG